MSSVWKNHIEITIFGESHGSMIGVVLGNLPSGLAIDQTLIQKDMARRVPGRSSLTSSRKENDDFEIVSGLLNGYTTGSPLCALIKNKDSHSKDYEILKQLLRPGHSDYTAHLKYHGYQDIRGGGHFSGRLTACLVLAGSIARQILRQKKIEIGSHILQVMDLYDQPFLAHISRKQLLSLQDEDIPLLKLDLKDQMMSLIQEVIKQKDSVGGVIECAAIDVPGGLGEPFFDSIESHLASLLFSIPGVKGVEFGSGFSLARMHGSEANDLYDIQEGKIVTKTNHHGGILGGITSGMPLTFKVVFKPTSSIALPQSTINIQTKEKETLVLEGRHDPCIALRAPVIVEAVLALVLLDELRYDFR